MQSVSSSMKAHLRPPSSTGSSLRKLPSSEEVQKIVQAFNTWAYKREQPSDIGLLKDVTARAVMRRQPLPFVLYWGKGPRSEVAEPDIQCLDYLASMAARVKEVYRWGAQFSLVLTDTHATLNGHTPQSINSYFTGIEKEAEKRGFTCYLLSELTDTAGRGVKVDESQTPSEETIGKLTASAMRWYRGGGSAEEGARKYYQMNMIERQVIELFFPSTIFVTFNGRDQRELFPENLPIFYMYSLKRGFGVKPWFLTDADLSAAAAND
jgi:hypothetical protein